MENTRHHIINFMSNVIFLFFITFNDHGILSERALKLVGLPQTAEQIPISIRVDCHITS